jgi:hypothetical protein
MQRLPPSEQIRKQVDALLAHGLTWPASPWAAIQRATNWVACARQKARCRCAYPKCETRSGTYRTGPTLPPSCAATSLC